MKWKPKLYEDEPDPPDLSIGSFNSFTTTPRDDKKVKPQIGFIRQKCNGRKSRNSRSAVTKKKRS